MLVNVFSVKVRTDSIDEVTEQFKSTARTYASQIEGFQGMMGLIDDETGDTLSIGLLDNEPHLLDARESKLNMAEINRYVHTFVTEPERRSFKLELRYMPHNASFPGEEGVFARSTTGAVNPRNINRLIARSRDSLVFESVAAPGNAGFLLCSDHSTGTILGISMWKSMEALLDSESESGYYQREMDKHSDLMLSPYERRVYRVFDRLLPGH
jgi:quinol monooxygenase YgiN/heme-degrading monooxygenase HmoA